MLDSSYNIKSTKLEDNFLFGTNILKVIDDIKPQKLGSISYSKYVVNITETFIELIKLDSSNLLVLIKHIKDSKPCYKRDLLVEVLDSISFCSEDIILHILTKFNRIPKFNLWKDLANSLVTLPDLIAGCKLLNKFKRFQQETFFSTILEKVYTAIELVSQDINTIKDEQKWCYLMLLGRIAISGHTKIVWKKIIQRSLENDNHKFIQLIGDIITIPLQLDNSISRQFEIFIEPLILPIFLHQKPTKQSGNLIHLLLQNHILRNESFEYIVCNKLLLQCNYERAKLQQKYILFNIFSYLSNVTSYDFDNKKDCEKSEPITNLKKTNLLVKTLLLITQSWSNKTKVLFRTHEHNRYISYALIIAFRHALDCDKECLSDHSEEIQSMIIQGFNVYLERSSSEQRNLSMCVGELLLPKLHQLIDDMLFENEEKQKLSPKELKFDVNWDVDCLELRHLFNDRIDELFENCSESKEQSSIDSGTLNLTSFNSCKREQKPLIINDLNISFKHLMRETIPLKQSDKREMQVKPKIILLDEDNDEEDLLPYYNEDCDNSDFASAVAIEDEINTIPIYLRDCIDGLMENKDPNYVRLCLIKVIELIYELRIQEPSKSVNKYKINTNKQSSSNNDNHIYNSDINDAISDNAIELAQILLYLDDQYNIEGFCGLRMKALISLAISAPALVVKYLLDEYNSDNRNIRHQLDILQVLVSSAQNLSEPSINTTSMKGELLQTKTTAKNQSNNKITSTLASSEPTSKRLQSTNGFAKYASLYFYGIVHRLKISLGALNQTIVFVNRRWIDTKLVGEKDFETTQIINKNKKMINIYRNNDNIDGDGDKGLDDSYMLSRILFSISLIIKCLNQQPITCKLSNDLLDILAAYKCHRDIGVRRAIISCLTVIRDCTPSVYFEEYLYSKTENLFGAFIANECDIINRLRIK